MFHYNDVIKSAMASQITSLTIVYSTIYSGADERKHQSSASLALVRGIHRWPVNSPHKGPVTRKIFPFDGVIMYGLSYFSGIIADNDRTNVATWSVWTHCRRLSVAEHANEVSWHCPVRNFKFQDYWQLISKTNTIKIQTTASVEQNWITKKK